MEDYPLEYYEFFVAFNEEDYYTCHDLLEEIWMTDKENFFIKGLLQMSVAIYHYSYGNVKGARSMMMTAYRYLQPYRPKYWGLDLEKVYPFIEEALSLFPDDIDSIPFEEIDKLPTLPRLYLYIEDSDEADIVE
jgi:predicted metal-dependent hydrolase